MYILNITCRIYTFIAIDKEQMKITELPPFVSIWKNTNKENKNSFFIVPLVLTFLADIALILLMYFRDSSL